MFGNLAAAAWRSACRDRLHALLNLGGLALGLAAAILIGLYVRDELTVDRFLPNQQEIYNVQMTVIDNVRAPDSIDATPHTMAAELTAAFPEITKITRLGHDTVGLRHDQVEANEEVYAVDPSFFQVLAYKLLVGDPATALAEPNSAVLSRSLAIKYFGTIDCVGQTMEIDRQYPVRVTGVLDELPATSDLDLNLLVSGQSQFSRLARLDAQPKPPPGTLNSDVDTYLRLLPGVDPAGFRTRLDAFMKQNYPPDVSDPTAVTRTWFRPLASLHLHRANPDAEDTEGRVTTLWAVAVTGTLILLVAAINFVNLVTARATRRAVEVGVRKALGATRGRLIAQFMGESVATSVLALVLAVAMVELVLPGFNSFLDRSIRFAYWRDPALAGAMLGATLLVGVVAGIYPALVQSSFRPAVSLKSRGGGTSGSALLRQALVILQFSVSIGLLITTSVIYRQTVFATHDSLSFATDQIVTIETGAIPTDDARPGLLRNLKERLAGIPGVRAVTGSWVVPNAHHISIDGIKREGQPEPMTINRVPVDFGFFEMYGLKPIAGRSFEVAHHDDAVGVEAASGEGTAIINATAVRVLGYASPQDALGKHFAFTGEGGAEGAPREIVGVMPDMQLGSVRSPVAPTTYLLDPAWDEVLSVKLDGTDIARTLDQIDRAWQALVPTRPIQRSFIDERIEKLYRTLQRQGTIFASFALVAVAIGCLGLFGLSAFTAERRTKEIGVRKALGASTMDVVRLLVWQFARPVLIANAIAWPIAWVLMTQWLDGFAYRIALGPLIFLIAGGAALIIAVLTTAFHAIQVARARPVTALRYE